MNCFISVHWQIDQNDLQIVVFQLKTESALIESTCHDWFRMNMLIKSTVNFRKSNKQITKSHQMYTLLNNLALNFDPKNPLSMNVIISVMLSTFSFLLLALAVIVATAMSSSFQQHHRPCLRHSIVVCHLTT